MDDRLIQNPAYGLPIDLVNLLGNALDLIADERT